MKNDYGNLFRGENYNRKKKENTRIKKEIGENKIK